MEGTTEDGETATDIVGCLATASRAQGPGSKHKLDRLLQDTLFADLETYEFMAYEQLAITAWYVATEFEDAYDVGLEAAQTLAARFPGDTEKAGNVAWYETLRESELSPLGLCADFSFGRLPAT